MHQCAAQVWSQSETNHMGPIHVLLLQARVVRSVTFMASNNLLVPTLTLVCRDKSAASQRDQLGGTKWLSILRPLVARP